MSIRRNLIHVCKAILAQCIYSIIIITLRRTSSFNVVYAMIVIYHTGTVSQ